MIRDGSPAWRRWLPGLAQVLPPAPGAWRADTFAGVSVAILMIPVYANAGGDFGNYLAQWINLGKWIG